jgi:hypothetical protein
LKSEKIDYNKYKEIFIDYYYNAESDEDLQDWMSDSPPTYNKVPLFDKERLENDFNNIAKKTPLSEDMILYRSSRLLEREGLNSYTIHKNRYDGLERCYKVPKGTPIIFASGIADDGEFIWNPTKYELSKYRC